MRAPSSCPDGCVLSSIEHMFDSRAEVRAAVTPGLTRDEVIAGLRRSLETAHPGVSLGWGAAGAAVHRARTATDDILPQRTDTPTWDARRPGGAELGLVTAELGRVGAEPGRTVGRASWVGSTILPVSGPLGALLPDGGVPRGGVVGIRSGGVGGGGSSLLLSLVAAIQGGDGAVVAGGARWAALVGVPELGLLAAAELGVSLDRLAVVPDPGDDALQVISVLADGVEVIVAGAPRAAVPPARVRVLRGRLRTSGAVLLVAGDWPGADLVITAQASRWSGLGNGHGRLIDRDLAITVEGRRFGRARSGVLRLSGRRDGTVAMLPGRPFTVGGPGQQAEIVAQGAALPA